MEGRWQDLGAQEDPDPTPRSAAGWAALARHFELLEQERPAWQADALCLEYPDLPWFAERGEDVSACREVCGRCMVADECASLRRRHRRQGRHLGWCQRAHPQAPKGCVRPGLAQYRYGFFA